MESMDELPFPLLFGSCSNDNNSIADINLDDVFADVFYTSDLLDVPANDNIESTSHCKSMSIDDSSSLVLQGRLFGNSISSSMKPSNEDDFQSCDFTMHTNTSHGMIPYSPKTSGNSTGELTEAQKLERRERNREHAKRSRVRKKFLLESLQRSVDELSNENDCLRDSIREHLGARGDTLIAQCTPEDDTILTENPLRADRILEDPDYSLVKALQMAQQNFVITDASSPDNPIVYASRGFLTLTGYTLSQILGRNCRFLQGPETDPRAVDKIRSAITKGEDTSVCLLNYRQDGSTFWNQFFVAGLRDSDGNIVNYVGVQSKVSEEYAALVVHQQNIEFNGGKPSHFSRRK